MSPHRFGRRGFTLIELLVAIGIIGLLLSITIPAVMYARSAAHRTSCQNNMKQIGLALLTYEASLKSFPPGQAAGSYLDLPDPTTGHRGDINIYATAFAMLLPYLEQDALAAQYDYEKPWDKQPEGVVEAVIPILICPENAGDQNPWTASGMERFFQVGQSVCLTDYILCKGVYDGWCLMPWQIPADERGMFDLSGPENMPLIQTSSFVATSAAITDGQSSTFAMGEGAGGPQWLLCKDPGCKTPYPNLYQPGTLGREANNPWAAQPSYLEVANLGLIFASVFGSTIEPLNKRPVTHTVAAAQRVEDLVNCSTSYDWKSGDLTPVGPHRTSNFRSDHPGGGYFLFADGSVRFVEQSIDQIAYRKMSTIAEEGADEQSTVSPPKLEMP